MSGRWSKQDVSPVGIGIDLHFRCLWCVILWKIKYLLPLSLITRPTFALPLPQPSPTDCQGRMQYAPDNQLDQLSLHPLPSVVPHNSFFCSASFAPKSPERGLEIVFSAVLPILTDVDEEVMHPHHLGSPSPNSNHRALWQQRCSSGHTSKTRAYPVLHLKWSIHN